PRTIRKHVAEVAAALGAVHFGSRHEEAAIFGGADRVLERLPEARPAGSAFELRVRAEQRVAASGAIKGSASLFLIERTGAGPFSAMLAEDVKLARRKGPFPLRVGLLYGEGFVFHNVSLPFR